jgi:UDP-N-acetyl-D-mannosaminuronic acid dehydrogenase
MIFGLDNLDSGVNMDLFDAISKRACKIGVIGLGYVGTTIASVFANRGFIVLGCDVNRSVVKNITSENLELPEPELAEMIATAVKSGKLWATIDSSDVVRSCDIIIICVQTPITRKHKPNLSFLRSACETIGRTLMRGKLVIIESTVPPKTTRKMSAMLESISGLSCGKDFWLSYCPERLAPSNAVRDFINNNKIIGGVEAQSTRLATHLFRQVVKGKIFLTDSLTAEIAKLAENTFRYVNIAYANELALICEQYEADVKEVINLANTHPRVNINKPGCGVGGPCLSKDTYLLFDSIKTKNFRPAIVLASRRLNDYMPEYITKLTVDALGKIGKSVENSKIAVFGTAYKGEVNDARNSPAEEIIRKLISLRARVVVYDPYCNESFGANKANDIMEAVRRADCIVIATDHKAFGELELPRIKVLMKEKPIIVDGRRIINPVEAERQGFMYVAIGYSTGPSIRSKKNTRDFLNHYEEF